MVLTYQFSFLALVKEDDGGSSHCHWEVCQVQIGFYIRDIERGLGWLEGLNLEIRRFVVTIEPTSMTLSHEIWSVTIEWNMSLQDHGQQAC